MKDPKTRKLVADMKATVGRVCGKSALTRVFFERKRQDALYGEQNHSPAWWMTILAEEFGEAAKHLQEGQREAYLKELIEVAAVAVAAVESEERQRGRRFSAGAPPSRLRRVR